VQRGYDEVTPDRVNSRNGYRRREWDIRAGTIELAIPKLCSLGSVGGTDPTPASEAEGQVVSPRLSR
jgi:hypothetical protein